MNKHFLFIFFLIYTSIFAQTPIKDFNAKTIGVLKNQVLYSINNEALYNIQGQIIFRDTSKNKNDITLTVEVLKKKTRINEGVETNPKWIIRDKKIFFRKNQEDFELIKYQIKDGFTSFYNSKSDSLIAFLPIETLNNIEISLVFYYLWNYFGLEPETLITPSNIQDEQNLPENILGYMKPVFGDPLNVWVWDGELFYPAYDASPFYIWTFDGSTLKPLYNSRIEFEWTWDGEELRPFWGGHPRNNWIWENNIFRQVFENNYKYEYEFSDGVVRKRFGSFNDTEWEIFGSIPLPLISIVILGIANR